MRNLLFALLFVLPLTVIAQRSNQEKITDSIKYYHKELSQAFRTNRDSLMKTEKMVYLSQKLQSLHARSRNYYGTVLFANLLHSNYSAFNKSIAASGFPEMNTLSGQFSFGLSSRTNRGHFDFYFFNIGFNNKSKKGDEKITSSLSNTLQMEFGYSALQSDIIDIYPYLGASLRIATLNYSTSVQTNSNYSNITNIVINDRNVRSSGSALGYQAGIGIDLKISSRSNKTGSTLLFLKAGTNGTFGKDKYRIEGVKYEPVVKKGDWFVGIGFKFVGVE